MKRLLLVAAMLAFASVASAQYPSYGPQGYGYYGRQPAFGWNTMRMGNATIYQGTGAFSGIRGEQLDWGGGATTTQFYMPRQPYYYGGFGQSPPRPLDVYQWPGRW